MRKAQEEKMRRLKVHPRSKEPLKDVQKEDVLLPSFMLSVIPTAIFSLICTWIIVSMVQGNPTCGETFAIMLIGSFALSSAIASRYQISSDRKAELEARAKQEKEREDEAKAATQEALRRYERAQRACESSTTKVKNLTAVASNSLAKAETCFEERVFGPFWDAAEATYRSLDSCTGVVKELEVSVRLYYASLEGREHTFPTLEPTDIDLSPVRRIGNELRQLVGKAQRDFEFSSILEQRRTRDAIVAGFSNLGDSIAGIEADLEGSMNRLQENLDQFAEMQVQNRQLAASAEQEQMAKLQEIQEEQRRQS